MAGLLVYCGVMEEVAQESELSSNVTLGRSVLSKLGGSQRPSCELLQAVNRHGSCARVSNLSPCQEQRLLTTSSHRRQLVRVSDYLSTPRTRLVRSP